MDANIITDIIRYGVFIFVLFLQHAWFFCTILSNCILITLPFHSIAFHCIILPAMSFRFVKKMMEKWGVGEGVCVKEDVAPCLLCLKGSRRIVLGLQKGGENAACCCLIIIQAFHACLPASSSSSSLSLLVYFYY